MIAYLTDLGLSNSVSHKSVQEFLTPDGVLYIVMNRPEVQNAFNSKQIVLLTEALENAASNPEVKVVVLCGEGKNFCAGGDINYMKQMGQNSFQENKEDALQLAHLMQTLNEFPKPTIARVNGAAYGGGVGLLCCCDMAFGTEDTKICLSEVKIGMVPATIAPYVMNAIGLRNAHRLMLTAEVMQGQEAVNCNFLNAIFPTSEFSKKVDALALKITTNAPNALEVTKSILLNLAHQPVDEGVIDYTADVIASVRESEEGKEGLTSFIEKRKPNWTPKN
ncbi:enoyl-CoA hydratase-related protein [Flavobacteriaceae bacterium]|nr:enoyl-CoA hydratase-related protein [Flavobacteriaceae bacterium]MDC1279455.1 enoyl-CoA hydratase-related protein [bacterium]